MSETITIRKSEYLDLLSKVKDNQTGSILNENEDSLFRNLTEESLKKVWDNKDDEKWKELL